MANVRSPVEEFILQSTYPCFEVITERNNIAAKLLAFCGLVKSTIEVFVCINILIEISPSLHASSFPSSAWSLEAGVTN